MPTPDYTFRYRLFLSVDLAGSTAFKRNSNREKWVLVFEQFFEDFPRYVRTEHSQLPKALRGRPDSPPAIWKYVGDEILFYTELSRFEEAAVHLGCLKRGLRHYQEQVLSKHRPLTLKATAWTAGFPVGNAEVRLGSSDSNERHVRDFLGPAIDLGFRLTTRADDRRIPVNLELAFLLLRARSVLPEGYQHVLLYEGSCSFRGVLGEAPYPILWVDRKDGEATPEDQLLEVQRTCKDPVLQKFIDESIRKHEPAIRYPFIESDADPDLSKVPTDVLVLRDELQASDIEYSYESAEKDSAAIAPTKGGRGLPTLPPRQSGATTRKTRKKSRRSKPK